MPIYSPAITTPVVIADGGTNATTASGARTSLGVAVGSDVQAYSLILASLSTEIQNDTTTTSDATPKTIGASTVPTNSVVVIEATVIARDVTNTQRAGYKLRGTYYRAAAGTSIQGAVDAFYTEESDAAWDATFVINGADVEVGITGEAATNISWASEIVTKVVL